MLFENYDRIVFAGDSVTDMAAPSRWERVCSTIWAEAMSG